MACGLDLDVSKFYVKSRKCKECAKAYQKKYYSSKLARPRKLKSEKEKKETRNLYRLNNKDKINAIKRSYREQKKDHVKEYYMGYYRYYMNCSKELDHLYYKYCSNVYNYYAFLELKPCSMCKEVKFLTAFNKMQKSRDGVSPVCRECSQKEHQKYNASHREDLRFKAKIYSKNRYEQDPEGCRRYGRQMYALHREKLIRKSIAYSKTPRGKVIHAKLNHKRRTTKQNVITWKDADEWIDFFFDKVTHCGYCGCVLTDDNKTVDHLYPLSGGGAHMAFNLIICCKSCNSKKSGKQPYDYFNWPENYYEVMASIMK
jgi:5-methylcytosine-specific restriction endonuclease McrA